MATTTRELPVRLTEEEILWKGERVSALFDLIGREKADFKAYQETHKSRLRELEEEQFNLARQVVSKHEDREVEVVDIKDYDRFAVDTVRRDTGEVIGTRGMTMAERQETLPFRPRAVPVVDGEGAE